MAQYQLVISKGINKLLGFITKFVALLGEGFDFQVSEGCRPSPPPPVPHLYVVKCFWCSYAKTALAESKQWFIATRDYFVAAASLRLLVYGVQFHLHNGARVIRPTGRSDARTVGQSLYLKSYIIKPCVLGWIGWVVHKGRHHFWGRFFF